MQEDQEFRFSVQPPLEWDRDGTGRRLRISKTKIPYAKFTALSNTAYSWTEQQYLANGAHNDAIPANMGNDTLMPAYELTGSTTVPVDGSVIAPLWLSPTGDYYLFQQGGGGGSNDSLLVTDGTHNCSNPSTLLMNGTYFIVGCANGVASVIPKVKTVSLVTGCNDDGSSSFGNFVVFDV